MDMEALAASPSPARAFKHASICPSTSSGSDASSAADASPTPSQSPWRACKRPRSAMAGSIHRLTATTSLSASSASECRPRLRSATALPMRASTAPEPAPAAASTEAMARSSSARAASAASAPPEPSSAQPFAVRQSGSSPAAVTAASARPSARSHWRRCTANVAASASCLGEASRSAERMSEFTDSSAARSTMLARLWNASRHTSEARATCRLVRRVSAWRMAAAALPSIADPNADHSTITGSLPRLAMTSEQTVLMCLNSPKRA
mmetsp:Transcript_18085/g.68311  ORF Transcript_18085/g.68311 Transcript_18085/m.68311 type:complete len:266 (+) Transcript_18085:1789-2586(+)